MLICDFHRGTAKPTWLPGTVIQQVGGPNYIVKLPDSQIVRRHAYHICVRESGCADDTILEEVDDDELPIQPTPVNASVPIELHRSPRVRKTPSLKGKKCGKKDFTHELFLVSSVIRLLFTIVLILF